MNKKFLMKALAVSVATVSASVTLMGAVGCGGNKRKTYNNDVDTLVFSSQDFDKVFNPFYSTSAMDANAVGMTQIGMIGNDKDGTPTFGDKEAVVAKDVQIATKGTPNKDETTDYYFVLKNNVKFSNGSYLTIKDVLFNMYVYLDPAYTGSSTMYSTDIVGLQQYRTQEDTEVEQKAFEQQFADTADDRISKLVQAVKDIKKANQGSMTSDKMIAYLKEYSKDYGSGFENLVADYEKAAELFKEELKQDFNNSKDSYADTKFTDQSGKVIPGLFTTDVEVFLYNEGVITWNKKEGKLESSAVNNVADLKKWTEERAIDLVFANNVPSKMDEVVQFWNTGVELRIAITGDAREQYFKEHTDVRYKNISGIQFANMTSSVTLPNGDVYEVPKYSDNTKNQVTEGNEVLKVTINGVDPKAIWNFAFGVAPMYYYSDQEHIDAFDYTANFGVDRGSQTFMTKVIKDPDKIGVPVGAGPYMAASASGKTVNDGIKSGDFLENNVMYFRSNPHYLMGEPLIKNIRYQVVSSNQIMNSLQTGEIDFAEPNAKTEIINQLKGLADKGMGYTNIQTAGYGYVGVNASKVPSIYVRRAIMHSIDPSLSIKYYDGTAKPIYRPMSRSSWAYPDSALAYYPYIGGPVPQNLSTVYGDYANYVRKLGLNPGDVMSEDQQKDYIKYLVEEKGGYTLGDNGVYRKGNDILKYTFTIAGQENDHPAFTAMYQAGVFLNKIGFQIITKPDNQALTKLSTGDLAVWAAAWGSTIDPDMYQVYHKDSKATSTLNWGYNSIKNNQSKYTEETRIINELSKYIDSARKTTNQADRKNTYAKALDLVMQLAVELPMYQRDDLFAYNAFKIDISTFTPENDRSAFKGLTSDIYKLSLVTNLEK
ncbi:MAG: hypothetical protein K2N23_04980 [Clostridia bacterium]|nr:hypothetical protein [Clostridia bacterium]